jgi:hypothetical protein
VQRFFDRGEDSIMRCRIAIALLALTAALNLSARSAMAFDDATYPDLSGLWRAINLRAPQSQPTFDPTRAWGRAQEPPLTSEYQAVFEASLADQASGGQGNWPSGARCMPPGMPATMTVYSEMEIVVLPEVTHLLFNHNTDIHRRIYTDGRDWPARVEPSFEGYSIGRWIDSQGAGRFDTLEIETRDFKGPRALDPTGIPTHADNQSIVKERIFFDRADPKLLHDEITLIDHALTHPWTVLKTYRRDPSKRPHFTEQDCAGNNANVVLGQETYWLSADRVLMPTRKDQPLPRLSHFSEPQK